MTVTGPVVDQLDVHVRAEHAALRVQALAHALVERLGDLGPGGVDVRRAVALAGVAVERELARCRAPRARPAARSCGPRVGEDAQRADLVGEPVGVGLGVGVGDAEQDEQARADRAGDLAVDGHRAPG